MSTKTNKQRIVKWASSMIERFAPSVYNDIYFAAEKKIQEEFTESYDIIPKKYSKTDDDEGGAPAQDHYGMNTGGWPESLRPCAPKIHTDPWMTIQ